MNWDDTTEETAPERLVGSVADREDQAVEAALRPKDLGEFIGQEKVREQLDLVLRAARARGATADHVLLSGAPGLGKTTLSMIIAAEMGAPIRITSGPAIQHAGDLAAILSSLQEGEVLFLDEIHRMSRPAEEMLYMAMEDFRVDVIVGKGPGATAIPLELPPSRWSAPPRARACCRPAARPLRFHGAHGVLRARRTAARHPPLRGPPRRGDRHRRRRRDRRPLPRNPRIANRLLRRVRDYAQVKADGRITRAIAEAALKVYEVDGRGLDRLDRGVLEALLKLFGGGPVGLSTLAVAVGEERETVEEVAEPFLVREGLLARTPRGRVATPAAWAHLGLSPAQGSGQQDLFGA